jgi:phosphonoacetaldehyde hydrolase
MMRENVIESLGVKIMAGKRVRALMLDWAGTTIDFGSRAPAEVFAEVFRRKGIDVTTAEARGPMGMAKRDHISAVIRLPRISQLWEQQFGHAPTEQDIDALYAEFLPLQKSVLAQHSEMIPGVVEVIDRLKESGIRMTSSTGYTRELMQVVTAEAAQQGYAPEVVFCAEDARAGRPAPWMIFRAAEAVDVYPLQEMVVIDDTIVGLQAGIHAGAWTVGVVETGNSMGLSRTELEALSPEERAARRTAIEQTFLAAGADFVVDSVANIEPILNEINRRLAHK